MELIALTEDFEARKTSVTMEARAGIGMDILLDFRQLTDRIKDFLCRTILFISVLLCNDSSAPVF